MTSRLLLFHTQAQYRNIWSRVDHAGIVIGRQLTPRGARVNGGNHGNMTLNTSSQWVLTPVGSGYPVRPLVTRLRPPTRNGPLLPFLSKQIPESVAENPILNYQVKLS